jgi:hypothetical protein
VSKTIKSKADNIEKSNKTLTFALFKLRIITFFVVVVKFRKIANIEFKDHNTETC